MEFAGIVNGAAIALIPEIKRILLVLTKITFSSSLRLQVPEPQDCWRFKPEVQLELVDLSTFPKDVLHLPPQQNQLIAVALCYKC
jgi:hypothetical protein